MSAAQQQPRPPGPWYPIKRYGLDGSIYWTLERVVLWQRNGAALQLGHLRDEQRRATRFADESAARDAIPGAAS